MIDRRQINTEPYLILPEAENYDSFTKSHLL